uniref:adhesion G-protein coupled receptor G4-like n=1 Tax=Styela clava TaxID=7725 RepID=UPI00193ACA03|nr:adhesion G-protein coupled receptor G4-like [Styela clava]
MKVVLILLAILHATSYATTNALVCNEGFNVSLGGIPLYHWSERNCTSFSKCFGQNLKTRISALGNVELRYGACITSSYANLLNCEDMFGPESTVDPSQLLNLVPDIEKRFTDLYLDFVYGGINEFTKLLSRGENIDEFLSGFVKFMEYIGFNMTKFQPLQPSLGKLITALFNASDRVTMNSTAYDFFLKLSNLDTDNARFSRNIFKFMENFFPKEYYILVKKDIIVKNSVEKVPGLLESMFPTNSNLSLWYYVIFDVLGNINITHPKKSVADSISIIRSAYNIPEEVTKVIDPVLNALPDLFHQLSYPNSTSLITWYLDLLEAYTQRNNATEALGVALTNFISKAAHWTIPYELKTTLEWMPGFFYKYVPSDKLLLEKTYRKIENGLKSFNFSNLDDTAKPTKLSNFVLSFARVIGNGFFNTTRERAYVINLSAMFYDIFSNYTTQLDDFFQILTDGFQHFPNFDAGKIISNLTIAMGGQIPQEVQPFLDNLQFVINKTFFEKSINATYIVKSYSTFIKAYTKSFPDSEFPSIFQNLIDSLVNILLPIQSQSNHEYMKILTLRVLYFTIDVDFALFKIYNISTSIYKTPSPSSQDHGLYLRLMSVMDPNDVKQLAKEIVEWSYNFSSTAPSLTSFVDATRPSISAITSKFTKTVIRDFRSIFSPDICKFGVCNSDLCNTHTYIDEQNEFIKPTQPTTTTSLQSTTVLVTKSPQLKSYCFQTTIQSLNYSTMVYTFPTTEGNTPSRSLETCANSNYSATVKCIATNRSSSGSFDIKTLEEYACEVDVNSLIETAKMPGLTSARLESTMGELSSLSSKQTSKSIKETIQVLDVLKEATKNDNINITEEAMVSLLWIMDDIHSTVEHQKPGDQFEVLQNEKLLLLETLEVYGSNLVLVDEVFTKMSETNLFQAQKINFLTDNPIVFHGTISNNGTFQPSAKSFIPKSAIPNGVEKKNAVFYLHKDATLFPTPSKDNIKVNQVLSSQISKSTLRDLKEPVMHSFTLPLKNFGSKKNFITQRCSYLNLSTGVWEFNGCKTIIINSNITSCTCDHMTNFAVLVQTHDVMSSYAIQIVGYIGCSCSSVALILVLIIYLGFQKLRSNQVNQILIHLSACLLVGYLTFLIGVERPRDYISCMAVGAILQFSFLSAWGWMFSECVTMYKKLVTVFNNMSKNYVIKTAAIVYIVAFIITMATSIIAYVIGDSEEYEDWELDTDNDPLFYPSYYVSDRLCWLHGYSLYFGFLTPVAFAFVANLFGFIRILRVLAKPNPKIRSTKVEKDMKDHALRILTVSILLGVTWVFAIPMTMTDDETLNEIFSWLFSIANAFQGVFIFVLFCVRREDVRQMWMEILPCTGQSSSDYSQSLHTVSISTSHGTLQKTDLTSMVEEPNTVEEKEHGTIV